MGICILTFQDEADGSISVSMVTDPIIVSTEQEFTDAQLFGLMYFHQAVTDLKAEFEAESDETSKME